MSESRKSGGRRTGEDRAVYMVDPARPDAIRRFPTTIAAARWLRDNGHPKAADGNIRIAAERPDRRAYGYMWLRRETVEDPGFDAARLIADSLPEHARPVTATPVSGGEARTFADRPAAVRWLRDNGHPKATTNGIAWAQDREGYTCYGYVWRATDGRALRTGTTAETDGDKAVYMVDPARPDAIRGFACVSDASRWLRAHGHPKAADANITMASERPSRRAYGYMWLRRRTVEDPGFDAAKLLADRPAYTKPVMATPLDGGRPTAFRDQAAAVRWLKAHGHPKAQIAAVGRAVDDDGRTAYGYMWQSINLAQ